MVDITTTKTEVEANAAVNRTGSTAVRTTAQAVPPWLSRSDRAPARPNWCDSNGHGAKRGHSFGVRRRC